MRLGWPKSLTVLVTGSCVLLALPLLLALSLVDQALRELAGPTRQQLDDSLAMAQIGTELRDDLLQLERLASNPLTLGDPSIQALFQQRLRGVDAGIGALAVAEPLVELQPQVVALRQGQAALREAWLQYQAVSAPPSAVVGRIRELLAATDPVIAIARRDAGQELERLRLGSQHARRVLLGAVLALLPLTVLVGLAVYVSVTRPLRRMARGVEALGHGEYEETINVGFPHEMARLARRLDWLRRRLGVLEADKDQFLRNVSHELKTPLASLREGAALLREGSLGKLTPEQREVAQILTDSSAELEGLIINLLTYAEWRNHRRRGEPEWFDVRALVEDVLNAHRLPLSKRQLRTELQLAGTRLFGQRAQLRVALDNLVTNAVKHAPAGSVIQIQSAQRNRHCELAVRDEGRGVPDADKERIFEPFVRGVETEEFGVRGTGVGLAIVRETALAHGGTVTVEDAHPGARFRLQWPVPHG